VCGICGKLNFDPEAKVSTGLLKAMADTIHHRGPDDEGFYTSGQAGLGFRRLSIIDLATGHQPIGNEDGSVWVVFNGEIYNYKELGDYLRGKGHILKTQTDTEVIVHLYEELGEACVEKLRGMFAFAIWDDRQKVMFLARDRVGIKPLYYWQSDKCLIFASEIKAILADPSVNAEVFPEMIDRFLTFNYMPGEETLFKNIYKLAPGSCMTIKDGKVKTRQYWDLKFAPAERSMAQAEQELMGMLEESVRLHMISDVPVGFLLSGGVDSTAMLGLAVGKTDKTLNSFTIGFSAPGIADERPFAAMAAKRYGSDHHEMTINARDFMDFLPKFAWHMEEPVCEPPAVALYYVSRMAKDYVKVLISGEGGDEAFAGYPNYRNFLWLERFKSAFKPFMGPIAAGTRMVNGAVKSDRVTRYAALMNVPFESYYFGRTYSPNSYFNDPANHPYANDFSRKVNKTLSLRGAQKYLTQNTATGRVNRMLYVDTKTWLPDELLVKADKITMANSIELRVPFLDHKFLEFAASLPENFKVRGLKTKFLAKKTLEGLVPQEILDRKKAGFPVPYARWMRTELKDWVHDILFDRETMDRGYFDKNSIEQIVKQDSDRGTYPKEIFSLVALELWHRQFLTPKKGPEAIQEIPSPAVV
jgi:asparagine synthase (glutamine-hydrolysing)